MFDRKKKSISLHLPFALMQNVCDSIQHSANMFSIPLFVRLRESYSYVSVHSFMIIIIIAYILLLFPFSSVASLVFVYMQHTTVECSVETETSRTERMEFRIEQILYSYLLQVELDDSVMVVRRSKKEEGENETMHERANTLVAQSVNIIVCVCEEQRLEAPRRQCVPTQKKITLNTIYSV